MNPTHLKTALIVALPLALSACGMTPEVRSAPAPIHFDSAVAIASFDSAWSRIRSSYYDTTFRGHNWVAVRDSLRPIALRAKSMAENRRAIESLFAPLGESHFALVPNEVVSAMSSDAPDVNGETAGYLGLEFRVLGERVVVSRVDKESVADSAGVQAGWELVRVGRFDVAAPLEARRSLKDARARKAMELQIAMRAGLAGFGDAGDTLGVQLRDDHGSTRSHRLPLGAWRGEIVRYGPLPPQHFSFSHDRLAVDGGCVGVIRFSSWLTPLLPLVERAMEDVTDCRGVVIDLRGNTGGVAAMVMGVSGFFLDTAVSLGTLQSRRSALRYMANPRRSNRRGERIEPYHGALAILTDPISASTSEIFAQGMRDIGRARIFGDTTAGQALPASLSKLPSGDLLMHVIADFHSPSGNRLEANGVIPDEMVPLRRTDLLAGIDAPMREALRWIDSAQRTSSALTRVRP